MKAILLFTLTLFSMQTMAQFNAQELVSADGGSFIQPQAKMDWSIGETITETFKSHNLYLSQGFLQGASISLNNTQEISSYKNSIQVFPNPFSQQINLQIYTLGALDKAKMIVLNQLGQIVQTSSNLLSENNILLPHLPNGIYVMQVLLNDEIVKTFKIQKID